MRRLPAVLPLLFLLVSTPASADHKVGPAIDLMLGGGAHASSAKSRGIDGTNFLFRFGIGLQYGPVAALVHAEASGLTPAQPMLDSDSLRGRAKGVAVRYERRRKDGANLMAQLGYTWRVLDGDREVSRTCDLFEICDAGFYREVPSYNASGPYVAVSAGLRGAGRHWPAIGVELGAGLFPIDRPGNEVDDRGTMVWLALHVGYGGGFR